MANRKRAIAELTADDRGLQRGLARAERRVSSLGKLSNRSLKAFGSVAGGVAAGATSAAVGGASALALSEAKKTIDFEEALTRLKINSQGTVGPLGALRDRIFDVSRTTGVAREEILGAASAYVTLTGDGAGATAAMELFAKVAKGTGAQMSDVSSSAAAMSQNLRIDPADMERAFSILISGGKKGAIELRDVAGLLAELAPLAAQFQGGTGIEGLADLGAGLQLVRRGFGSAGEAATGLQSLMGAIVQHAGDLEKAGIKVFNKDAATGKKTLRGFEEIVDAIGQSKLMKDPTALVDALGRKEAYSALLQLTKVRGEWGALATATLGAKDATEDFVAFSLSNSGRLESSWNRIKNRAAEALTGDLFHDYVAFLDLATEKAEGFASVIERIGGGAVSTFGGPAVTRANKGEAAVVPLDRKDADRPGFFDVGSVLRGLTGQDELVIPDSVNTMVQRNARRGREQAAFDRANTGLPFDMAAEAAAGAVPTVPFPAPYAEAPPPQEVKVRLDVRAAEGFDVRASNERGHTLR